MVVFFFGDFHPMVESIEQKHLTLTNTRSYIVGILFKSRQAAKRNENSIHRALETRTITKQLKQMLFCWS